MIATQVFSCDPLLFFLYNFPERGLAKKLILTSTRAAPGCLWRISLETLVNRLGFSCRDMFKEHLIMIFIKAIWMKPGHDDA